MGDTIAGAYATIGNIEFVNNHRTLSYLQNGLGPGSLNIYGDCGCSNLVELLDCPGVTGYVDPVTDVAPWYSPDIPASGEFLGFLMDDFQGMSSTFKRRVIESVGHGGILSKSRLGSREMVWRGYLFGATCCATQYGLRWLVKTLSRLDATCRDCEGDDLELLVCCPETGESAEAFRLLKGVGLIDGPEILSERKTCSSGCSYGCGGSCIIEVEFTLVASQPYFYSSAIPVYDCVSLTDGAVTPYTDTEVDCGPFDCSDTFFEVDGICPLPELPPTATYTNSCFESITTPFANYYSVSRSLWNELEEVVPVISITTGTLPLGKIQLGFYTSSSGAPCSDLAAYPPDCDVICDELQIIAIPANSTFYIDGRTRKMALICADQTVFPGERLTAGPWSWPSFSCYGFCMEVQFETAAGVSAAESTCVSLSLVPRTF